jgi:uncharacterized protein (DUF58 family)
MTKRALFDAELLSAIEAFALRVRHLRAGPSHGERRTREAGSGLEFRDFRAYTEGDDPARVDWNVWARSGRLFVRLADQLRTMPLRVHLDLSGSLGADGGARSEAARVAAVVFAALGLAHHDPVHVSWTGANGPSTRKLHGRNGLLELAAALEDVEAAGETDLVALFQLSEAERRKPGVSFIISDFFDPAGLEPIAGVLNLSTERCVLVRIFEPQDKSGGSFAGELHLVDCESGLGLDADVDDSLRARYCEAFSRFEQEFDHLLLSPTRAGCALDATRPVLGQLEPLFPAGSLSL